MPPHKKQKPEPKKKAGNTASSSCDVGLSSAPVDGEPSPITSYMTSIISAYNAVKEALPEIATNRALPMRGSEAATEGPLQGLTGFSEPWTQEVYDDKYPTFTSAGGMDCALTLYSLDVLGSMTPWVPFDEQRVRQLIPICFAEPRQFPYKILNPVDFGPNVGLQANPMSHCMPPELLHALVLSIADKIGKPTWETERKQWVRVLLSMPCTLVRMDKQDDRYSQALNKRTEYCAVWMVTKLTVRQTIYNVYGFKMRKERNGGSMSADKIAAFYQQHCKTAPGEPPLSKAAIDQCLTILNRLFSLPKCETIVANLEKLFGPTVKQVGITLNFLQEVIYRCRSQNNIEWMLEYIWDGVCQKYLSINDLTLTNMKSATRTSISDIALHQRKLKDYLTGAWLDQINLPSDAKSKLREIFQSYPSYRKLYNPGVLEDPSNPIDRTFLLKWHPAAVETVNLFEMAIFSENASITYRIREAVRNGRDAADTLALQPFSIPIETIREKLNPTANSANGGDDGDAAAAGGDDDSEVGAKQTHIE